MHATGLSGRSDRRNGRVVVKVNGLEVYVHVYDPGERRESERRAS